MFYFCDLDHNERIDPFEFISSLVTYSAMGTEEEKAKFFDFNLFLFYFILLFSCIFIFILFLV